MASIHSISYDILKIILNTISTSHKTASRAFLQHWNEAQLMITCSFRNTIKWSLMFNDNLNIIFWQGSWNLKVSIQKPWNDHSQWISSQTMIVISS